MIRDEDILAARILIVDRQEANVRLLEEMLAAAGYTDVSASRDPEKVCALHRAEPYDLILLDLPASGADGFAVLEGLKSIEPAGGVPVLVATAEPGHKFRALHAGARDFIGKPFDSVEMQARIRNLLEVRLLHRQLERHTDAVEEAVLARTAELRASEERFQRLTELSSDWYWEQDATGRHTRVSGLALEMLGLEDGEGAKGGACWNEEERAELEANIAARRPFLDLICTRIDEDGSRRVFQMSGEPFFGPSGAYAGYRGIGVEVTERMPP